MPIHPKPFDYFQHLRRLVFGGRPKYFNAIDLNKELSIIHSIMDAIAGNVGVYSTLVISVSNIVISIPSPGNTQLDFDYTVSPGYVSYQGVRLNFLTPISSHYTQIYTSPGDGDVNPPIYFIVGATLTNITFGTDPVICGITSDEYPQLVPSVDAEQYKNLLFKVTHDVGTLSNLKCKLAVLAPSVSIASAVEYKLFPLVNKPEAFNLVDDDSPLAGTLQQNWSLAETVNFVKETYISRLTPAYMEHTFNFRHSTSAESVEGTTTHDVYLKKGNVHTILLPADPNNVINHIIPHSSYREGTPMWIRVKVTETEEFTLYGTENDGGFYFYDGAPRIYTAQDMLMIVGFKTGENYPCGGPTPGYLWFVFDSQSLRHIVDDLVVTEDTHHTEVLALINAFAKVPIGGIIMYNGSLGNFDGTGLGIQTMVGWGICNGQNGTPDLRGRFIVGYGADGNGVDPDAWDPQYASLGNQGGKNEITLVEGELPAHVHAVDLVTSSNTHAHSVTVADDLGAGTNIYDYVKPSAVGSTGNATHTHTVQGDSASTGSGEAHENRPPYYTLAYIMRLT